MHIYRTKFLKIKKTNYEQQPPLEDSLFSAFKSNVSGIKLKTKKIKIKRK
jgi:hypothetical protein